MSDVRHKIWIGSATIVDIDVVYNPPELVGFTFDRNDISFDSNSRTFDENPI
jgi:hypothetical protein